MTLSLDIWILIITFCVSVFSVYRKENAKYLQIFPPFLLFTIIIELTGAWYKYHNYPNTLLYNLYSVVIFPFYTYFFSLIIVSTALKKRILQLVYILPVISLTDLIFFQGRYAFNTYSYSIGCLTIVVLSMIYFYQLFQSTLILNLLREPSFWIITGLLFSFATSVSLLGIINYISTLSRNTISQLFKLLIFVNSLLYILFIIAFVCKLNFRKSTPSI